MSDAPAVPPVLTDPRPNAADGPAGTPNGPPPALSVVIPAWNEAGVIGDTVRTLRSSLAEAGVEAEIIVVDDDSDDGTAAVAAAAGAIVLAVACRQIAAVRNAGARIARAPRLLFVDADTRVGPEPILAAMDALDAGAAGGGARVRFDRRVPLWAAFGLFSVVITSRLTRLACGCFLFCRREAFEAVGGFDEAYYATEEVVLSHALKREGRMVIVPHAVTTSARKVALFGARGATGVMLRIAMRGPAACRGREGLEVWYGTDGTPPRETGG